MFSKAKYITWLFLSFCLVHIESSAHQIFAPLPDRPLTKDEIYHLLPKGSDMQDHEQVNLYKQFLDRGNEVYPLLMEIISESDDPYVVGSGLAYFRESNGDKVEAASFICDMIPGRILKQGRNANSILNMISAALGDIGDEESIKALYPMADHDDIVVSYNALIAISKKGDETSLKFMKQRFAEMPEGYEKRHLRNDLDAMHKRLGVVSQDASQPFPEKAKPSVVSTESFEPPESPDNIPAAGDDSTVESPKEDRRSSSLRNIIFPVIGILFAALLVFFRLRKR